MKSLKIRGVRAGIQRCEFNAWQCCATDQRPYTLNGGHETPKTDNHSVNLVLKEPIDVFDVGTPE